MLKRKVWVVGVLALAAQMVVGEARADNWFDFGFLWPRPHRARAYYADPYYMPARPRGNFYSDPGPSPFDDSYYDPTIDGPRGGPPPVHKKPVKKKVVKAKPAISAPAVTTAATTATAASKTASAQPVQTVGEVDPGKTASATGSDAATTASTTKLATASGAISCDKAQKVVAGFGFSDVKPATCSGKIYAFNAVRDGKPYAIKLDAASGELTEVKKAQP